MPVALDTNVVSEVIKPHPDPHVLEWIRRYATADFVLPAPCLAELLAGLRRLPEGSRRLRLEHAVNTFLDQIPGIVPFDQASARAFATITTMPGRPRPTMDSLIAAICAAHDLPLATRNVRDFSDCGITVIDPWQG